MFLIFEEFLRRGRRSGRSDQRRGKESEIRAKGEIGEGERRGEVRRFILQREYNIFHLQDDVRNCNNHDYGSEQQ